MKKKKSIKELLDEGKSVKLFCLCGEGGKIEAGDVVNVVKRKDQYSMYGSGHVFIDFDESILSNFILLDEVPKHGDSVVCKYDIEIMKEISKPGLFGTKKNVVVTACFSKFKIYDVDSLGVVVDSSGVTANFHPDYFIRIPEEYRHSGIAKYSEYLCINEHDCFLEGLRYYTDGSGVMMNMRGERRQASTTNFVKVGEYDCHIMPMKGEYYEVLVDDIFLLEKGMTFRSSKDCYLSTPNGSDVRLYPSINFESMFKHVPTPKKGMYYKVKETLGSGSLFTIDKVYHCSEDKFIKDDQGYNIAILGDVFKSHFEEVSGSVGYTLFYQQINENFGMPKNIGVKYVFVQNCDMEGFYGGKFKEAELTAYCEATNMVRLWSTWYNRDRVMILGYGLR